MYQVRLPILFWLGFFALTLACVSCERSQPKASQITKFPSLLIEDVSGRSYDSRKFQGQYLYLRFFSNHPTSTDHEIIETSRQFGNTGLFRIIFVLSENMAAPLNCSAQNVCIVRDRPGGLRGQLGAPECCDSYQIFNPHKELMRSSTIDIDYKREVMPFLLEISKTELLYFDESFMLRAITAHGLGNALLKELAFSSQGQEYYLIGLVSNVCSSCPVSLILNRINRLYLQKPNSIGIIIMVSDDFNPIDIKNLLSFLAITIPILKSTSGVAGPWNQLIGEYPRVFDNIFLIINRRGEIVQLLDYPNSAARFLAYLDSICEK